MTAQALLQLLHGRCLRQHCLGHGAFERLEFFVQLGERLPGVALGFLRLAALVQGLAALLAEALRQQHGIRERLPLAQPGRPRRDGGQGIANALQPGLLS